MRSPRSRRPRAPRSVLLLVVLLAMAPMDMGLFASPAGARAPDRDLPGEDMSDPLWIEALPWVVTGNSCDYELDYAEFCPYGDWSPDVVYAFTPQWNLVVTVDLCGSYYDTKLLVYENSRATLLACSDDACSGPNYAWPYLSRVEGVPLEAGSTYYFVVKGYCGECGIYIMNIAVDSPCIIAPPPDSLPEGEPECHDGYVDVTNGGCDAQTPAFLPLLAGGAPWVVSGTSGTYITDFTIRRDTDWFAITLHGRSDVSFRLAAEFDAKLHIFDAAGGCEAPIQIEGASSPACGASLTLDTLEAGDYWLRVSPSPESSVPCGARYLLAMELEADPAAVEPGIGPGPIAAAEAIRVAISPQPARRRAEIHLALSQPAAFEVALYDPAGRRVRTLLPAGEPVGGRLRLVWDGRDERGHAVPSGVYTCRVRTAEGRTAARPLLMLQ